LLGHLREASEVGIDAQTLDEQMRMIRHQAVRKYREPFER